MSRHPFCHLVAFMHPQIVHDEENLVPNLTDQPPHKVNEHRPGELALEHLESKMSVIVYGRDHIAGKAGTGGGNHRSLSFSPVARPCLMGGKHPLANGLPGHAKQRRGATPWRTIQNRLHRLASRSLPGRQEEDCENHWSS